MMNVWTVSFVVVELEAVSFSQPLLFSFRVCVRIYVYSNSHFMSRMKMTIGSIIFSYLYIVYLFVYVVRDAPSHSLKKKAKN